MTIAADYVVQGLSRSIHKGGNSLVSVPGLLRRVITEDLWRSRTIERTGEHVEFDSFERFVVTPPLKGLGASIELIRNLVRSDPVVTDLIDRAMQRPVGTNQHAEGVDNVNTRPTGNTASRALRQLRSSNPELHARVLAGELSPHRAAVMAGHRRETFTVPADPEGAARALLRRFRGEDLDAFMAALNAAVLEIRDKR